jgi:hypothetical protein
VAMSRKKKPDGAETKELFFFFFFFWAPERRLFKRSIRWSTNVYTTHFFFLFLCGQIQPRRIFYSHSCYLNAIASWATKSGRQ